MEFEISSIVAAETIAVLENTEITLLAKVPVKILQALQKKADEAGKKFEIDYTKNYSEQNISEEARGILTLIYRQYWCNDEEKQELDRKLIENENKLEDKKRELYNPDKIFKNENKIVANQENINENVETIQTSEENKLISLENLVWYKKIFYKIKLFFHK